MNTSERPRKVASAQPLKASLAESVADSCLYVPKEKPSKFHSEIRIVNVNERIRQVDQVADKASVSISNLTPEELELARKLCEHFGLQLGTLVR